MVAVAFASRDCSLYEVSPSQAYHSLSAGVGGSGGIAVTAWLWFGCGEAESYRVHSCGGGNGDAVKRQGKNSCPLTDLLHLGGERRSNCRYLVQQRWQSCQCFLSRKQLYEQDGIL